VTTAHRYGDERPPAREVVPRTLAAGAFLVFELPLLLPVIVGWVAVTLVIRVRDLTQGRGSGPDERTS
jgi:hypothetical protein